MNQKKHHKIFLTFSVYYQPLESFYQRQLEVLQMLIHAPPCWTPHTCTVQCLHLRLPWGSRSSENHRTWWWPSCSWTMENRRGTTRPPERGQLWPHTPTWCPSREGPSVVPVRCAQTQEGQRADRRWRSNLWWLTRPNRNDYVGSLGTCIRNRPLSWRRRNCWWESLQAEIKFKVKLMIMWKTRKN